MIILYFLLSFITLSMSQVDPFKSITIRNSKGLELTVIPFGATVTHLRVPDKTKVLRDVVLGWDDPTQYKVNPQHPYFGALIGRYANRISNGTFKLDGYVYHTPMNEEYDTLHGGDIGYDRRVWTVINVNDNSVTLGLEDADLVEAFPGNLHVVIRYTLTEDNSWQIDYDARTDSDSTVINLTQHTYWNLNGFLNNTQQILDHVLQIDADSYTPIDEHLLVTGQISPVTDAPWLDFREPKAIGKDISKGKVTPKGGYDNNWVLNSHDLRKPVVTVSSALSGITMQVFTTQPGLQFYSGNFLDGTIPRKKDQTFPGGSNETYHIYSGFALEAQHFPDSMNYPHWPTTILKKGETYKQTTIYHFTS